MPPPVTSTEFRKSVISSLPQEFLARTITDPAITGNLQTILQPVLAFYGRADAYQLLLVKSPVPIVIGDSGVLLVMTTTMVMNAQSDDELLGYVAHEIGHEYYADYSVGSRYFLRTAQKHNEPALQRKLGELFVLVELQCDAFAAITLSHLGYNPIAFQRGIEKYETAAPTAIWKTHPLPALRLKLVQGIAPGPYPAPRQSTPLHQLKEQLALTGSKSKTSPPNVPRLK